MMKVFCLVLLAFASLAQARLNLVLVGATGDLAQKYLYQSLYEQVTMKTERKLMITPAATRDEAQGQKLMDSFLVGNITCRDLDEEIEIYGTCKVQEDRCGRSHRGLWLTALLLESPCPASCTP